MDRRAKIVRQLRASGATWVEAGKAVGVSSDTAKCLVDPEYKFRRRSRVNALRKASGDTASVGKRGQVTSFARPSEDDVAARLAEIPPDTRNLTGYLMGDPLPGRSALAQRTLREVR